MKKLAWILLIVVVAASSAGAMLITQNAALVSGALTELKFEAKKPDPNLIGAPPQFTITKATIEYLQKLQKAGKTIEVQNDGALKIK